jgi:hypothetical protein
MQVVIYSEDPEFKPIMFEANGYKYYNGHTNPYMLHVGDPDFIAKLRTLIPLSDDGVGAWKARMLLQEKSPEAYDMHICERIKEKQRRREEVRRESMRRVKRFIKKRWLQR